MRRPYTQLYVHLVWATWDRLPLILPTIEPRLYAAMAAKCDGLKCHPMAIGGIENHVHLLAGIPSTVTVADLVKGVKGSTSHLLNHAVAGRWFSVAGCLWRVYREQKWRGESDRVYSLSENPSCHWAID